MAVAFDATSESHPSSTGTTATSFSWTHTPNGTPRGIVVMVCHARGTFDVTGVTYGGVAMSYVADASDTLNEPGTISVWHLGASIPTGAQTIQVTISSAGNLANATAISFTASSDTEIYAPGIVIEEQNQTLSEENVNDGSPGSDSVRVAALYSGLGVPPAVGANTTLAHNNDMGAYVTAFGYETTPGQGSRPVGFTSGTSDDVAAVYFAVRETAPPPPSEDLNGGSYAVTGYPLLTRHSVSLEGGSYGVAGQQISAIPSVTLPSVSVGVVGSALSLMQSVQLSPGAHAVTGGDVFVRGVAAMAGGSINVEGSGLFTRYSVAMSGGSYAASGADALSRQSIAIGSGSYASEGFAVSTRMSAALAVGSFSVTGNQLSVRTIIPLSLGEYDLVGGDMFAESGGGSTIEFPMSPGSYVLSGGDLTIQQRVSVGSGSYAQSGGDLLTRQSVPMGVGAYSVTGYPLSDIEPNYYYIGSSMEVALSKPSNIIEAISGDSDIADEVVGSSATSSSVPGRSTITFTITKQSKI